MQCQVSPYRILRWTCILCAALVTIWAWKVIPIQSMHWSAVLWFVAFSTLAELLSVNLAGDSNAEVTPTPPVHWAAACVLGPLPSIIVCVSSMLLAEPIACVAFKLSRARADRLMKSVPADASTGEPVNPCRTDRLYRVLSAVGRIWEPKAGTGFVRIFESSAFYDSLLILMVGISGMFYAAVGGQFLINGMPADPLMSFVLPFLGLATVAVCIDVTMYALGMAVREPVVGVRGIRGIWLRMHLVLLETALPVVRAQMLLVVVSLMLAYLYVRVGPWGFVLTGLPVVALRDFYSQWGQEQSAYLDTISTLATYMQHYHPYTRGHLKRVAELSTRLARELRLPTDSIMRIGHAGLLHDIGKIAVSEEILDKTGKLELAEWETIKTHPSAGAEIISHLDFLEGIVDWIKYHHKWHDGRGYPDTKDGDVVPIEASIIAVADSFDAMTDDREMAADWVCDSCGFKPEDGSRPENCPSCGAAKRRIYRKPRTLDEAIDELRRGSGSQFHPRVVKAFLTMLERDGVHLHVG